MSTVKYLCTTRSIANSYVRIECNDHGKDKIDFSTHKCIFSFLLSFHANVHVLQVQIRKLLPSETNVLLFLFLFFSVLCMRAHETTNDKKEKKKN